MLRQVFEFAAVKSGEASSRAVRRGRAIWGQLDRIQRGGFIVLAALLVAAGSTWVGASWFDPVTPTRPNTCVLIDADSRQCVELALAPGMGSFPMRNPATGRATLWPAEFCFSTACAARGGTAVLLNRYIDRAGPTRCPRCGAEVTLFNARPTDVQMATTRP